MAWWEFGVGGARSALRSRAGTAVLVAVMASLGCVVSGCSSGPSRSSLPTYGQASTTVSATSTSSATTPQPGRGATSTHELTVWASQTTLSSSLRIISTQDGQCFGNSNTLAGGYRCTAGNLIYDFCFAPPTDAPQEVACLLAPWASGVHILKVTGRLPEGTMPAPTQPWAFELSNGGSVSLTV